MADLQPLNLAEAIQPVSLRVHPPSSVIFLCGGLAKSEPPELPESLRAAFLRLELPEEFKKYRIVVAEAAEPMLPVAGHRDLLTFESDIAGVVALILLFSESPGSLAELGAFAALPNVASKLLVVIDDGYYEDSSFIRNGPIASLETYQGDEWVLVLDREDIGVGKEREISNLDLQKLNENVVPAAVQRLEYASSFERFDSDNDGHFILLLTGLVQLCGALTITELKSIIEHLGFPKAQGRISNFLYCSELMGWMKKTKKGNHTYYVCRPGEDAIDFTAKQQAKIKEKVRWKAEFRAHWQKEDKPRFRAISELSIENENVE